MCTVVSFMIGLIKIECPNRTGPHFGLLKYLMKMMMLYTD